MCAWYALRRLPASTTAAQRLEVVASAIAVLGLEDVRHALIGDEEVRPCRYCCELAQHSMQLLLIAVLGLEDVRHADRR
jgi:hypothetical protein